MTYWEESDYTFITTNFSKRKFVCVCVCVCLCLCVIKDSDSDSYFTVLWVRGNLDSQSVHIRTTIKDIKTKDEPIQYSISVSV